MSKIPKYVATCDSVDPRYSGSGDTPDDALEDFVKSGEFENYCACSCVCLGTTVDVEIWTAVDPKCSDWPEDEIDPAWVGVLHKHVRTVPVEYIEKMAL